MLKVFRDNLKYFSWVLWIVIAAFILFYIPDFMTPQGNINTAVAVWDEEISYSELQEVHRNVENQLRQTYGDELPENMAQQMALNQLINSKILLREARRLGLEVGDDELSRRIVSFPAFQGTDGKFIGRDRYVQFLRSRRMDPAVFEANLRHDLLQEKLQSILADNLVIPDGELERAYRESTERARIRYLQLPASRFAEEVEVTDEEIASHFEEHRADYRLPERRDVAYLSVKVGQVRRTMEIDESELFAYYQENEQQFRREEQIRARQIFLATTGRSTEEARAELEDAKARIEAGESFATLAQEISEDAESAARGGDMGFIRRGENTPEFEEAAFSAEPGTLVGPVEASFGVHLIRVEERREASVQPFAEARNLIESRLAAERAPDEVQTVANDLAEELRQLPANELTVERLQTRAEGSAAEVAFGNPGPLARDGSLPDIGGRSPAFFDAVFELDEGELSEPVALPNGDRALVYLEEVLPPRDQELDEVRETIRAEIASRKQQQMAVNRLDEVRQTLQGSPGNEGQEASEGGEETENAGATFEQIAEELGITVQETAEFGPRGPIQGLGYNAQVARAAFEKDEGDLGGPFETATGALLFEVLDKTEWDPAQFAEQKDQLRERLKQERQQRLLSSIIFERRDELRADGQLQIFDPELRSLLGS